MPDGLRSILGAATLAILGVFGMTGGPTAADVLTIQGSSTFSTNILTPNEAAIEAVSGQSIKIVGIRSDIGLLRLLGAGVDPLMQLRMSISESERCGAVMI